MRDNLGMAEGGGKLSIVIASDDWFWRSVVALATHRCNRFGDVRAVDDGYTALAETWQMVDDGAPPDVYILDCRGPDPSMARLLLELRADEITRSAYVAVIGADDQQFQGADHVDSSYTDADDWNACLERIADLAQSAKHSPRP